MRAYGSVRDAVSQRPVAGARVVLAIGDMEIAELYSDRMGRFEYREEAQYIGELITCSVEKVRFEPREVNYKIAHDAVELGIIELVPEIIELKLDLKDEKKNPLERVKVSLEIDGEQVGISFSDRNGLVTIKLSPDFEEKTIKFKAELKGFEIAKGEFPLKKETSHEITLNSSPGPLPDRRWPKIAAAAGSLIVAGIVAFFIIKPPPQPEIIAFRATPPNILRGGSSTLTWQTSKAQEVEISGIGLVPLSGSQEVSPERTTTYTLIARDEEREQVRDEVTIVVRARAPEIFISFEAEPPMIPRGESSTLRWRTEGAEGVEISGIGGVELSGSRRVTPPESTPYTLLAWGPSGEKVERMVMVQVTVPSPGSQSWCEQYAIIAVEQNEVNLSKGCGFMGPRWSSNYDQHYEWCLSVPKSVADSETRAREEGLSNECAPPQPPLSREREEREVE
jgi:hypothetical protein